MLRVTHVLWSSGIGGLENLVIQLASIQRKNPEQKITLLFAQKFSTERKQIPLEHICLNLKKALDFNLVSYQKAHAVFRQSHIIHFHTFNPFLAFLAGFSSAKIVYSLHGGWHSAQSSSWRTQFKFSLYRFFLRKRVDHLILNSRFTQDFAQKYFRVAHLHQTVIPGGITFPSSAQLQQALPQPVKDKLKGKFIIGTVARFVPSKRIHLLLEALSSFSHQNNTVLLLVGGGAKQENLQKEAQKRGLENKIVWAGFQENPWPWFQAMNICVFPFAQESFGLVAIEAMSLGKPVLVWQDGGGIREIMEQITPENVVDDMAHLLKRLDYFYSQSNKMSSFSNELVAYARKFDISSMVKSIEKIYATVQREVK